MLARDHIALVTLRSADTATGVLEHAADGFPSSGATSALATDEDDDRYDDMPQSDDYDEHSMRSGSETSVPPSRSCSVTSQEEPLLECADYRKIRDLNRCPLSLPCDQHV